MAEALVEHGDPAAAAAPFVEVAHHQHRLLGAGGGGQRLEQALHLLPPLAGTQPEMGDDDAQGAAVDGKLDIDGAARLIAGDAEIDMADGAHGKACQQRIAEAAAVVAAMRARHDGKAGGIGEIAALIELPGAPAAGIDLLQADDVGAELAQHRGGAVGGVAAVDSDAAVNVVGGDDESAPIGLAPCPTTPASDHAPPLSVGLIPAPPTAASALTGCWMVPRRRGRGNRHDAAPQQRRDRR